MVLLVVQGPPAQHAPADSPGASGTLRALRALSTLSAVHEAVEVPEVLGGAAQVGQGLAGRRDPGVGVGGWAVAGGLGTHAVTCVAFGELPDRMACFLASGFRYGKVVLKAS